MNMNVEQIKKSQKEGAALEPDATERARLRAQVVDYLEAYIEDLPRGKAFQRDSGPGPNLSRREQAPDLQHLLIFFVRKLTHRVSTQLPEATSAIFPAEEFTPQVWVTGWLLLRITMQAFFSGPRALFAWSMPSFERLLIGSDIQQKARVI